MRSGRSLTTSGKRSALSLSEHWPGESGQPRDARGAEAGGRAIVVRPHAIGGIRKRGLTPVSLSFHFCSSRVSRPRRWVAGTAETFGRHVGGVGDPRRAQTKKGNTDYR